MIFLKIWIVPILSYIHLMDNNNNYNSKNKIVNICYSNRLVSSNNN